MFCEDKTTQMAAQFLACAGGSMPYQLLMTLLYIADKQMLLDHGSPISYDQWRSMSHGPVLSATYDLIKAASNQPTYWTDYITTSGHNVLLKADPGGDDLSQAEDAIIDHTWRDWGHKDQWDGAELIRNFPEWESQGSDRISIPYERVLINAGIPKEHIETILNEITMQDDIWLISRSVKQRSSV